MFLFVYAEELKDIEHAKYINTKVFIVHESTYSTSCLVFRQVFSSYAGLTSYVPHKLRFKNLLCIKGNIVDANMGKDV